MTYVRCTLWTLLLAGGFALLTTPATSRQDPPLPRKDGAAVQIVSTHRDTERGGIQKGDLPKARDSFAKFAKYYAEVLSHPAIYKAPQEFKLDNPSVVVPKIDGDEGMLRDLNRFVFDASGVPPDRDRRLTADQADYIRELGAALDAAFKELIENHPDRIVKVNAARVLAHVCKSGAPAHFPTVTGLLANANTRTEVKFYLFHAAANLLAAYDVNELKTRTHVGQIANPKMVGELVKTLEDCVTNPTMLVNDLPGGKIEAATPEQLAVIGLVRRQAVRALAQVRYVSIPGPDGKTPLYPAYTLARVALGGSSDTGLVPAPGPAECAEAVIGLCTMAPVTVGATPQRVKAYNADVAVEAITAGLVTFASPRAANTFDKSLPWRSYSLRIADAMRGWRPLFDPDYDILTPAKYNPGTIPAPVEETYKEVVPKVLAPMDKVGFDGKPDIGAKVDIEGLRKRLKEMQGNPKRNATLFTGVKETAVVFPPRKN